jgi:hypothetical protein
VDAIFPCCKRVIMKSMITNYKDNRAVIVCSHIANKHYPILRAVRTEPLEPEDSGWQFLCNSGEVEIETEAKIWLVSEVLGHDPSLSALINFPVGAKLVSIKVRNGQKKSEITRRKF